MPKKTGLTFEALLIVKIFLNGPQDSLVFGTDIMRKTELPSGTIYPVLRRLERHSFVCSTWEKGNQKKLGRPLRRYYAITKLGKQVAEKALERLR